MRLLRIFIRSQMIGHEVLNENIVEFILVVDNVLGGVFAFAEMMNVPAELFVLLIGAASVVNGFVESVALRNYSLNIVVAVFVSKNYFFPG